MEFIILASAHFLALLSPGPDFFIIIQTTLREDKKKALSVCAGIASANALYILTAVLGLEVMKELDIFINILKYLGGLYLLYIGVMLLKSKPIAITANQTKRYSSKSFFSLGFFCAFLNPKNVVFYFSLFALIVSPQTPLHVRIFYGLWMSFAVLFWDVAVVYMIGAKRIKERLGLYLYSIEKIAGGVLIFFGLMLML